MKFRGFGALRPALIAGTAALATLVSNQVSAAADSSTSVQVLNQQDPTWAGAPLGTSPAETIGSAGCAVTAVTMMLRYYHFNLDPAAFNGWLSANGGYVFDDVLVWDAVTTYSGGRVGFSAWLGADLGAIEAELDAGRPVVAEVRLNGNQHFVLLTGYSADEGLQMNDPWFGDSGSFNARYGDPSTGIVSIRTFMPAEPGGAHADGRMSWLANAEAAVHLTR